MLHCVPHEVLPRAQNQYPEGKNFEFPAELHGNYPGGVRKATGLHPGMLAPWDRELARAPELL